MKMGDIEQHYQLKYDELLKANRMNSVMTISLLGEIREVMTLRDHFAGLTLSGVFANIACSPETDIHFNNIAEDAYRMADAMLKQRSLTNA